MKYLLLVVLLGITACGELTPCERADTHPQGLCVIMHEDFEINDFILARMLFELELLTNETYEKKVNIANLFRKHEAYLEYVKYIDSSVDILGYQIDEQIKSMVGSCWLHYWVPAHEALHFYAQYHLKVSNKINATHQVEYSYVKWAEVNNIPKDETIEWKLAKKIANYCGISYKFLPEIIQVDDALGEEIP